ncbi:MAG: endopeptidase La, partial [Mesorhizobium sp.]
RIAGYTEDEKIEIAKRHLMPKVIRDHALQPNEFSVGEDAIRGIIQTYTREAGVRSLERELMKLGRKTVTGNLRDVMKESISAAASYVRSRAIDFGVEPPLFDKRDIHVHLPEGATPKDGPSAGAAMATAIVSVLTGIPVRADVAMTGEITLRGRILPIGGLKEKLLAALRGGIKKVLIPEENVKDLAEIPDNVKNGMEIVPVSRVGEVLRHALVRMPEPIEWVEPVVPPTGVDAGDEAGKSLAH